jgi:hypothetical protein
VSFPHERLEQRWWREWHGEDFSWQALTRKGLGQPAAGFLSSLLKRKTLQDYWRVGAAGKTRTDAELEREGELVRDPGGALWHVAHVPMYWRNGSAAKAQWTEDQRRRLNDLVTARLRQTEKSSFAFASQPLGADGRAQLQGAILLDAPSLSSHGGSPLRLKCDLAWLPPWDAAGETFGDGASFERSFFSGHVRLHRAKFEGCVSFEQARFSGDVVCGLVAEEAAARFPALASFKRALFLGDAHFDRCTVDQGRFDHAHFAGAFQCFAATMSTAAFDGAVFDGPVSLLSSTSKALSFSAARARQNVDFGSVTLRNAHLFFRTAVFCGPVSFVGAQLPRKIRLNGDGFRGTRFLEPVDFTATGVHWIAALNEARFEQGVLLDKPAPAAVEREFLTKMLPSALEVGEESIAPETQLAEQLRALEGGCRTVWREAAKAGDADTEQLYRDLEKKVRRHLLAMPASHGQGERHDE